FTTPRAGSRRRYTRSLHDALPTSRALTSAFDRRARPRFEFRIDAHIDPLTGFLEKDDPLFDHVSIFTECQRLGANLDPLRLPNRSEEHTSELQSRENLVCRLLPEK